MVDCAGKVEEFHSIQHSVREVFEKHKKVNVTVGFDEGMISGWIGTKTYSAGPPNRISVCSAE